MIRRLQRLTQRLKSGKTKIRNSPLFLRAYHNRDVISYWIVMTIVIYISAFNKTFRERHDVRRTTTENTN